MYPLDDFNAILCRGNVDPRDAGDEVLQRNAPLAFLDQVETAEFRSVAVGKAFETKQEAASVRSSPAGINTLCASYLQ